MSKTSTRLKPEFSNLGFDPDALREKYRYERDRRLRPEGDEQFIETGGEYAHYADDDPYVEPGFTLGAVNPLGPHHAASSRFIRSRSHELSRRVYRNI